MSLYRRLSRAQALRLQSRIQVGSSQPYQIRRSGNTAQVPDQTDYPRLTDLEDPGMNGGYINPPRIKRHLRDPYADWWDKQERRNFGEPVHEDNDILGMLSPHEYTFAKPKTAFFQLGCFVATTIGLTGIVYLLYANSSSIYLSVPLVMGQVEESKLIVELLRYPDRPSVSKSYEGGLLRELGGRGAVAAKARESQL